MKIAIHQPQYMPWLGYFDKMDRADVFVVLDDVQFKKNEWQNRNRIRTADSWQWMTVPVIHHFGQTISSAAIDNHSNWKKKHLKALESNYARACFYDEHMPFFREIYSREWTSLCELNCCIIDRIKALVGITADTLRSSSMEITGSSTRRLADICLALEADTYISGAGGRDYLDLSLFEEAGIKVEFQEYRHPVYEQVFEGFFPYMSAVDLLFCKGPESLEIIRSGRK
ncbi:MAG: hypothetical protein GF408_05775 [Candidatus Omnitrophica bacterium]|nr:hypothetical protein [Candidatus Omnitrophota bacterium]